MKYSLIKIANIKSSKLFLIFFLLLFINCLITSCSTFNNKPRKSRKGKLSGAMERASDTYSGNREVNEEKKQKKSTPLPESDNTISIYNKSYKDIEIYVENNNESDKKDNSSQLEPEHESINHSSNNNFNETSKKNEPENPSADNTKKDKDEDPVLISAGYYKKVVNSEHFNEIDCLNIALGGYFDQFTRFELEIGIGSATVLSSSNIADSIDNDLFFLQMGINYKYFKNPRYTLIGIYFKYNFSMINLYYNYKNTITVAETNEAINSDVLRGIQISAGGGINFLQTESFQIGYEASVGLISYEQYTDEGFDNDIFDSSTYLKTGFVFTVFTD